MAAPLELITCGHNYVNSNVQPFMNVTPDFVCCFENVLRRCRVHYKEVEIALGALIASPIRAENVDRFHRKNIF